MTMFLTVASVLKYIGYILMAIVVLLFMVLIHELGHYTAGKILKFKINEFSVGFGPKIFQKKKKNGELVSLRAVPLGGYCAFEGENEDGSEAPEAFNNQKPWKRLIVLFFGAFFNFLSAIIFSFILLATCGYDLIEVKSIGADSINTSVLQSGDVIYGVNGTKVNFVKDYYFSSMVSTYLDEKNPTIEISIADSSYVKNDKTHYIYETTVPLMIKRNKEKISVNANINAIYDADGKLEGWTFMKDADENSSFYMSTYEYSIGESLRECVPFSCKWAWKVLLVFGDLITGQLSITSIGGPVTTINMIATYSQQSLKYLALLIPVIAVNLAVFNLLPIPALDGFQMLFVLIEWIRKKPVKREVVNMINNIGLIVLFGFVIVVDILQFVL